MTVFLCSRCGTAITPELAELAAVPDVSDDERDRDKEARQAPYTVPRGHYATDPEPWGPPYVVQDNQEDPKPAQCVVANRISFEARGAGDHSDRDAGAVVGIEKR
ncbi:hypothetical protein ACIOG7_36610, partial [Streptomyces sp. NPDC087894]